MQSCASLRARHGVACRSGRFFGVSLAFLEKLLQLHRRTRALEPDRKRAGRPGLLDAAACEQVQRWLAEQNDLTLAERSPAGSVKRLAGRMHGANSMNWKRPGHHLSPAKLSGAQRVVCDRGGNSG
jgi:hypothetical protein